MSTPKTEVSCVHHRCLTTSNSQPTSRNQPKFHVNRISRVIPVRLFSLRQLARLPLKLLNFKFLFISKLLALVAISNYNSNQHWPRSNQVVVNIVQQTWKLIVLVCIFMCITLIFRHTQLFFIFLSRVTHVILSFMGQ